MNTQIGSILLENPLIDNDDVQRCLEIQQLGGGKKRLGQVLIEEGVITRETLSRLLRIQTTRRTNARYYSEPEQMSFDERVPTFVELVDRAKERGASDLLLSQGRRPWVRIGGRREVVSEMPLDSGWVGVFLHSILEKEQREQLMDERFLVTDIYRDGIKSCKATIFTDNLGLSIAVRLHNGEREDVQQAALSPEVVGLTRSTEGLLLVAGGARSGRSTTLSAIVSRYAETLRGHVVVLEENGEFRYSQDRSLFTYRKVGTDTNSLETGLRTAMRIDADMIVIDDLKGAEAVELAIHAASMGKIVIAGVRASSTASCLESLFDGVPELCTASLRDSLVEVLRGIVYQQLVPDSSGRSSVLVQEVVAVRDEVEGLIASGDFDRIQDILSTGSVRGSVSFDESLLRLVRSHKVSIDEAFIRAVDRGALLRFSTEEAKAC